MSIEPIPFFDLKAQYQAIRHEILEALEPVLDSQALILGPEVQALERELAAYCGVSHAVAVASGTDALVLALRALEIGPGDQVVTSAYSFFASAGAILQTGASPVFADIEPGTYNLDPRSVARLIGPHTRALLPVHLYGQCADMDRLQALAAEADIPIIEDAAQSIGARWNDRPAGSMGRLGCLSFYPTKNLGGIGDGGLVLTSDPALDARLRALRNHGQTAQYQHQWLGLNSRLDSLNAAALRVKLRHLEHWTQRRRANALRYRELLAGTSVGLPLESPAAFHVYNQFVVRLSDRDSVRAALDRAGIGSAVYYPRPLPDQPCLAHLGLPPGSWPNAAQAARQTLALPIYPELAPEQLQRVADVMASALRSPPV